jgi:hypothetical protein
MYKAKKLAFGSKKNWNIASQAIESQKMGMLLTTFA